MADALHDANVQQLFHQWINKWQGERRERGEPRTSSLYEWKSMLSEMRRLPYWLKAARTGTLPTAYQQYLHSEPEPIEVENRLICVLGTNAADCPILRSLYASLAEDATDESIDGRRFYADVTPDDGDDLAAAVCTWHIFTEKLTNQPHLDTSEGYVQDESDRRFWASLYESLSSGLTEER